MTLFHSAIKRENQKRPPVWFMRQAGRYHWHYQNLKKEHTFMELCKNPKLACETTLGPIEDFDFDAAILFSDLLFPLEAMGMGLAYDPKPSLKWYLREVSQVKDLEARPNLARERIGFQGEALKLLKKALPSEKALIAFVGAPLTLFCYAVEGSHQGNLDAAKAGLRDGRFQGFCEKLIPLVLENMTLQAESGADAIAVFDTCAGDFDLESHKDVIFPKLKELILGFKEKYPELPLIYYSKNTKSDYWKLLENLPISCLGVDWKTPIKEVLKTYGNQFAIQGNFDPSDLFLETENFEKKVVQFFEQVPQEYQKGWICGLGHGVLPKTPEHHVKRFLQLQKEYFSS